MDTIVSVASPIVKSHIGYLLSYKENLERLEKKVQRLEDTKTSLEHRIDEAQRDGQNIEDIVLNWLKKVNDTVADTKKLIDIEEARCCIGLFPNLWTKCQLSKKFEEMTGEISEDLKNGKFDRISYRVASQVTTTPFSRGYEALESRTSVLNEIKEALKDPNMYMIGVHGMGGVGKTTLVNELAWQVKKEGSFGVVVIANITHSPNVEKIQDQIAEALDQKLEKKTEGGRAGELRQRIQHAKSALIILDDIWWELNLTEVGIPFGDEHSGCKLVVTSRDLNVLKRMGTQKDFDLRVLLEEDSWNLFQKMAGDVVKEFNIKPIAEKVAKCCVGLPLLIVTVAKGLRRKDVTAWKGALIQLERFAYEDLHKKVYPALELSYNCLENDELKSLFLLIGSFGLNLIHTAELFSCCWGLDFYRNMGTLTTARNRYLNLIDSLRASSLLLEAGEGDEPEWVRMHDVVCDVAKSIASSFHPTYAVQNFTKMKEWPELTKYQYIIIPWSYIDVLPEKLECSELKLLFLENIGDDPLNVPNNFFYGTTQVRALHLYGMTLTSSVDPSFNLLTNLCSLSLRSCNLEDIRIVSKLKNLEILTLEGSIINEIPIEMKDLTQLRLLNLTNCSELRVIPANLMSSFTCIEELYLGGCYWIQWEVEGRESECNHASLGELRLLHQLTTLDISIMDTLILPRDLKFLAKLERCNILLGDMWRWNIEWSGGAAETSRTLMLTDSWWTSVPLTNFEELCFDKLNGVEDVLYELDEEGFPQLKHLHIQDSDELLHIINSRGFVNPHSAFPNLESLVLLRLNRMEEICHGPLPTQSFSKLKVIEVRDCNRLEELFSYSVTRNLSQLDKMKIIGCEDIIEIIAKEKQQDEKELIEIVLPELHNLTLWRLPMLQSFYVPFTVNKGNPSMESIPLALFNQQVMMPKLEKLKLIALKTCKIWDDKHPCFQNLIRLEVKCCDSLTSLFPFSVGRGLVKLKHLKINSCDMLKEIFVQQEEEVQFPNLETLSIWYMPGLKSIWPNQVAPNSFCKLKEIHIAECKNLEYVFPNSVVKELRQLQNVSISYSGIKNIVEGSESCDNITFVCLQQLTVSKCYYMKTIVPSFVQFPSLDELNVSECHGLVNIITPSATTYLPKLRILTIWACDELEEIYGSSNEGDAPLPLAEIAFLKLKHLELKGLPSLTSFCEGSYDFKFPSLEVVHLDECPMMETFCYGNLTTPRLTRVQYGWGVNQEDHWDTDLNTTITSIFTLYNSQEEEEEEEEKEDD